uniref:Uncharacterized protein n=1 Tax=Ciona savignyi TaxID=51511 RepID=H2YSB1_CIOSA
MSQSNQQTQLLHRGPNVPPASVPPPSARTAEISEPAPTAPRVDNASQVKKNEIKMKNRSSWSNLAQSWGSKGISQPLTPTPPQLPRPTNAADSFETFRK